MGHFFQSHSLNVTAQSSVVAGMMRAFIKNHPRKKIGHLDWALLAIRISHVPNQLRPGQPTPDLRVAWKKQDFARIDKLKGERETGVVGEIIKSERQRFGTFEPILVNLSPDLAFAE